MAKRGGEGRKIIIGITEMGSPFTLCPARSKLPSTITNRESGFRPSQAEMDGALGGGELAGRLGQLSASSRRPRPLRLPDPRPSRAKPPPSLLPPIPRPLPAHAKALLR